MLLWVMFALLTAAVLGALLWPFAVSRSASAPSRDTPNVTVYKDQLGELERDRDRGLISDREAEAARAEIARRLLSAVEGAKAAEPGRQSGRRHAFVLAGVALLVPGVALSGYLLQGAPGLPDQPLAARLNAPGTGNNLGVILTQVETRLRQNPTDGKGWDVIAPVYLRLARYDDAADAFGRAIRLLGESPNRLIGYGEALALAKDGVVSEESRRALEKALQLEPGSGRAQFWLALAKEQDGRTEEAAKDYRQMLAGSPPDAPWRRIVEARLSAIEGGKAEAPASEAGKPAEGAAPSPDMAAIQQMTPEQRQAMIEKMVQGLADRLKRDGGDLEGWEKLVRAYAVLGRRDQAMQALADARAKFGSDAAALDSLATLARSLGLSS